MNLSQNLNDVLSRVEKAAIKSGRTLKDIDVIAVTKTVDVDVMSEAIKLGMYKLGENKPQEIKRKSEILKGDELQWHMIGNLQKNKIKYIIDKVSLIHSLDRMSLAQELQSKAQAKDLVINVLVQVNVSGEESKSGFKPEEVEDFIRQVAQFKNIRVKGLMTMAPFYAEPEETRFVFKGLRDLANKIESLNIEGVEMKHLSMGMTNDFEVAIEEGSNMVRVGTGIFGARNY